MTLVKPKLIDPFGRVIDYVRLSVTDRCNFRCVYCMAEDMKFLPQQRLLTLEEMAFLGQAFVELGVSKIRLTGGEPLIRKNVISLFDTLGSQEGLDDLLVTTNGANLVHMAPALAKAGVNRINVSIDSLDPARFSAMTRTGTLQDVLNGIDAAIETGVSRIKLNSVIIRGKNEDEILSLLEFALLKNIDISFIEEMPLGDIGTRQRQTTLVTSQEIIEKLSLDYELLPSTETTAGPSRYFRVPDSQTKVGFISPHSNNFCGDCNRVRVTCEGKLLLCLGNEHACDLKAVIRANPGNIETLKTAIAEAVTRKPERHHFYAVDKPEVVRFMNMTGG